MEGRNPQNGPRESQHKFFWQPYLLRATFHKLCGGHMTGGLLDPRSMQGEAQWKISNFEPLYYGRGQSRQGWNALLSCDLISYIRDLDHQISVHWRTVIICKWANSEYSYKCEYRMVIQQFTRYKTSLSKALTPNHSLSKIAPGK